MAKTVDQLLIEIKAETSQLQKDLKQVKSKLGESNKEAKKFKGLLVEVCEESWILESVRI